MIQFFPVLLKWYRIPTETLNYLESFLFLIKNQWNTFFERARYRTIFVQHTVLLTFILKNVFFYYQL